MEISIFIQFNGIKMPVMVNSTIMNGAHIFLQSLQRFPIRWEKRFCRDCLQGRPLGNWQTPCVARWRCNENAWVSLRVCSHWHLQLHGCALGSVHENACDFARSCLRVGSIGLLLELGQKLLETMARKLGQKLHASRPNKGTNQRGTGKEISNKNLKTCSS